MDLVSAEWLLAHIDDADLRLADVRWYLTRPGGGAAAYRAGHLPGAVFVDLDTALTARQGPGRHPLPDPGDFATAMGVLGLGSDHLVVAYDDAGGTVAARLWWMLEDLGHERVAVLDGGAAAWLAAGGRLTTEVPSWPASTMRLAPHWRRIVEREVLKGILGTVTLLDARAAERYRGETEPVDPVAGHIPTARSAPTDGSLAPNGRFRSPAELRARFEALDAAGDKAVVTSCGSGVNACQTALAMRVAGLPDPLLYPGSYSDWSRAGMAVATGPEPGEPAGAG
jgi:thiosulfate/3-mercaptopyruvate sulfurtransferase